MTNGAFLYCDSKLCSLSNRRQIYYGPIHGNAWIMQFTCITNVQICAKYCCPRRSLDTPKLWLFVREYFCPWKSYRLFYKLNPHLFTPRFENAYHHFQTTRSEASWLSVPALWWVYLVCWFTCSHTNRRHWQIFERIKNSQDFGNPYMSLYTWHGICE